MSKDYNSNNTLCVNIIHKNETFLYNYSGDNMKNLKIIRENANMSVPEIAKILHVSKKTYYNYENGVTEPSIKIIVKLADLFNVSIDYLLGHTSRNEYTYIRKDYYDELIDLLTKLKK